MLLFFVMIVCQSCFLFSDFRKQSFTYSENGTPQSVTIVVPKGYTRSEVKVDSTGNEEKFFFYSNGAVLYFVNLKDTSATYQYINYDMNIAKQLYNTVYYKGIDSNDVYWRETRFDNFKAGYQFVTKGNDGKFDSSLNYFSLRSVAN